jgi:broad specificity phosphatase PhoE
MLAILGAASKNGKVIWPARLGVLPRSELYLAFDMKIYLVRHGQSRWQVSREDNDWNSPLSELGRAQAERLSGWLAEAPCLDNGSHLQVAAVHASPYLRSQQTAQPLAQTLGITLFTDDNLREADFLVSDHLPQAESPGHPFPTYAVSADYARLKSQASEALAALVAAVESSQGPVLAVSHGGLISTLLRLAAGSDTISFWIYNASLNLIEWKRGRWHLVHLNLWDHLPPPMRTF